VWNHVCEENKINAKALLSHLKTKGLIITGEKGYTKAKYIGGGQSPNCVWLKLPENDDQSEDLLP